MRLISQDNFNDAAIAMAFVFAQFDASLLVTAANSLFGSLARRYPDDKILIEEVEHAGKATLDYAMELGKGVENGHFIVLSALDKARASHYPDGRSRGLFGKRFRPRIAIEPGKRSEAWQTAMHSYGVLLANGTIS